MVVDMNLVSAQSITKRFGGIVALRDANFEAQAGEVHALLGENGAGKSTFIQILTGALRPDGGRLLLGGLAYEARTPLEAQRSGVSAVFQELSLVPDLTVAQNIWFRREPRTPFGTVATRQLGRMTQDLLDRFAFPPLLPDRLVRSLSLTERQIVEIAKALSRSPKVLILDEASSALPPRETNWLLGLARSLADAGSLVVFISHRLAEVRAISDRITVFRNGRTVSSYEASKVADAGLIADMLGRRLERLFPEKRASAGGPVALKVRNLTQSNVLRNVDLDVHAGEILGISGLQGHGQRELFLSLFGALPATGIVEVQGRPVKLTSPRRALHAGVALVPEDRRHEGLLLTKTVSSNLSLSVVSRFSRFGLLNRHLESRLVHKMVEALKIKAETPDQLVGTLSGGNQQKVVFGKILLTEAKILLLHDPTRGVDVGTKSEIFELMKRLTAEGYAILFYSSDLSEVVNMSHRVAVLQRGRVAAILEDPNISEDRVLYASMAGGSLA
jgi:ribose transport system ATP-binding protein